MLSAYRPSWFDGEITLLRATESQRDPRWPELARRCSIVDVPGDHYSIMRPPEASQIAAEIARAARSLSAEAAGGMTA
jgi:thioesterase domain-containing protein